VEIEALTWNLFNGRDHPPDPALFTWRSRLLGTSERNATHLQVNRDLLNEAAGLLATARWDVALLQECPPRWRAGLAAACRIRAALARRNPDLMGSWGGGSNLTLVREALGDRIRDRRQLLLRRRPERRKVDFARLGPGICVANLHASGPDELAEPEIWRAAEATVTWAGGDPLILGGDFNLRPTAGGLYKKLAVRFGLAAPTDPGAIDHLLARGLEATRPARPWPAEAREVRSGGLAIRLSDHAPVTARFRLPRAR
jgi:endonuclease/exonuclease/phosphatase family metal-dependent hydrolase